MSGFNKDQDNVNITFDQMQVKKMEDNYIPYNPTTNQASLMSFNQMFDQNNKTLDKKIKEESSQDILISDENINKYGLLPHQRSIDDMLIIIRETIFKTLELIMSLKNPIPYITETPDRFFSISVVLILIGISLLVISSLQK
jgi:hypothetical protein